MNKKTKRTKDPGRDRELFESHRLMQVRQMDLMGAFLSSFLCFSAFEAFNEFLLSYEQYLLFKWYV
mgnify:CR=1 FL=1